MRQAFILALSLLLFGCATPYQKNGLTGGFNETVLSPNVFRVTFEGNGYTTLDRAKDYALLRCAEVSLEHGFKYFVVMDDGTHIKSDHVYVPGQTHASYSGTTTAQIHPGGNISATTHGSVNSFTTPGFSFDVDKPNVAFMVLGLHNENDIPGAFDAVFLSNSIKTKYKIGESKP